ncbi:Xanthine dehydrogenase/oxidase [Trichoplax sp. H2]|nr:Xanthine dehydrogenase/oxidase [Trichoplax sp. H2]|eukprot:RDD44277.1 Xanthine dehydrogenase/oxidase [Trichoplax sp. H2]
MHDAFCSSAVCILDIVTTFLVKLTGTKLVCGEGGCGACTVVVSKYHRYEKKIIHYAVNSCLTPLCILHHTAVTTIEGIGNMESKLHPVQERIAKAHGSQCGFCTPGFAMSMYALLRNNPEPTEEEIEEACSSNLCRCTGYRPILDGYKTFSKSYCCQKEKIETESQTLKNNMDNKLYNLSSFSAYDPSQELIFPPELMVTRDMPVESLRIVGNTMTWFRPSSLEELLLLKKKYPRAKLVVGNTEVGIEMKFKGLHYPVIISPTEIPELNIVKHTEEGIEIGGCITLTKLNEIMNDAIDKLPEYKTRTFAAIVEMLRWFAGHQVRNVGSIAGNIVTASPISDLNPLLLASKSRLYIQSAEGERKIMIMDESFFTGYRKTCLKPDEIIESILIPYTSQNEYFHGFKQARRRSDDITIVNAGMRVALEKNSLRCNYIIRDCTLSFGGMAPITIIARKTSDFLVGREWNENLTDIVIQLLSKDMPLAFSTPGGMVEYRKILAPSFFLKFYLMVSSQLLSSEELLNIGIPPSYLSAASVFKHNRFQGYQEFEKSDCSQQEHSSMRKPMVHTSAMKQATGEAIYCDDMPKYSNELFAGLVLSTNAHAKIRSINYEDAISMPGVYDYVGANDIKPGCNRGCIEYGEEIFATEEVTCIGHLIGLILADTRDNANRAAKAVQIEYEDLPVILTIEKAIAAESFYSPTRQIRKGDVERELTLSQKTIEGEFTVGGQEHFYFETQSCVALPKAESGEMEIFSSTQDPSGTQKSVAKALGVPSNRVICRVKRLGGGFGGKDMRGIPIAVASAIAAQKTKRPVRCVLDRDTDMSITGTRHPYMFKYKVGFNNDGVINALKMKMYSNSGNTRDVSHGVMGRSILTCLSCYHIPNVEIIGYLCKTNIPSNTGFRGFGSPQAMLATETILTDIGIECGITQLQVREINLHRNNDVTHYNQTVEDSRARAVLNEVIKRSCYESRKLEVEAFNKVNRWKKRGIAIVPAGFPVSFTSKYNNQGGALVMIYTDGSVLLSHGGTEMGQGLYTKLSQICSHVLGVPVDKVHIVETNTSSVPNASPTAGSLSTDLNGGAVLNACEQLRDRIAPYRAANLKGKWEDWVKAAYTDRVNLSANGFYRVPNIGYNWNENSGRVYNYVTYGAAVSEIEIDSLTGDYHILRTDIVMDVGKSLNPAIDVGQIEGAFVQGIGLYTLEEQCISPSGYLLTRGPATYKIPSLSNIPNKFYIYLLPNVPNKRGIFSSKGIGEPSLVLASSVFLAIKYAIIAARKDSGFHKMFRLDSPATCERIRMACTDQITMAIQPSIQKEDEDPWTLTII